MTLRLRTPRPMVKAAVAVAAPLLLVLTGLSPATTSASAAAPGHDRMVSAVPAATTPSILDGEVYALLEVGGLMLAGGDFTSVSAPGGTPVNRSNLVGFNPTQGYLSGRFLPTVNGAVNDLYPGPTATQVYVAGEFTSINGVASSHLALLDIGTGAVVRTFAAPTTNGAVNAITVAGGRLIAGGDFTVAGGRNHRGIAAFQATTGALDTDYLGVQFTEHHNTVDPGQGGARGPVGVRDLAVNPAGTRIVVIGNFRRANGYLRDQIAMLNVAASRTTLSSTWATKRYEPLCAWNAFDTYMRRVAVSPNGNYFVVTATGGPYSSTLCDTASRFEVGATGAAIQPTWVSRSGGDTLWGVEITEQAVYVGGHQRWMNNNSGSDSAGPGAVPRPGLAAIDPINGVPLAWNPGRNPRGEAAYTLYANTRGLWLGSNTDYIGPTQYLRPRLAFFPLAGGAAKASTTVASLPNNVYLMGWQNSSTLRKGTFNGTTSPGAPVVDGRGVDWSRVRGAFLLGGTLYYGWDDGNLYQRAFTSTTVGSPELIDPYHDPVWQNVSTGSGQTYDGVTSPFYAQIPNVTGMFYLASKARIYYTLQGNANLYYRDFTPDSGVVGSVATTANGGANWSGTQGLFYADGKVYRALSASGRLYAYTMSAAGVPTGAPKAVGPVNDWRARALVVGP